MPASRPAAAALDAELELPGARLRYREVGDGPALVLIHGWALDLEIWEPRAASWAAQHRVIRYDRRGFGLSTGQPSLERDVEDALALLERLGVSRAVLVGASQGARVALRAAVAAPERVAGIVLDGPPDELGLSPPELALDEYRRLAQAGRMSAVRELWARHPFTRLHTADAAAHDLVARCIARYPGRDLLVGSAAPASVRLEACRCPALVIAGALDLESRRASSERLASVLPAAAHAGIAGAGHLSHLDKPEAYDALVLPFAQAALAGGACRS